MTPLGKVEELKKVWQDIVSEEAYLVDATGSDRRASVRRLNQLRRKYREMRETPLAEMPATTGECAVEVATLANPHYDKVPA